MMSPLQRKRFLRDYALSTGARFLYLLIETYADKDGKNAFPAIETTLVQQSGHDRKWVYDRLNELEKHGWLERGKRPGKRGFKANVYTLNTSLKTGHIQNGNICPENRDANVSRKTAHDQYPITSEPLSDAPAKQGHKSRHKWDGLGGQEHDGRRTMYPNNPH